MDKPKSIIFISGHRYSFTDDEDLKRQMRQHFDDATIEWVIRETSKIRDEVRSNRWLQ